MPIYNNSDYVVVMRPLPKDWPKDCFGIPFIKSESFPVSLMNTNFFLINPKNISSKEKNAKHKIVHSFCYDSLLKKEYDHPFAFLKKISGYYAVCSPDFSIHKQMQPWQIIHAVGASRWFGAFLQSNGYKVFPTVGWVDSDSYDICFSGLEDSSTFFISSLGVNNDNDRGNFLNGLYELRKRFPNSHQICVGQKIDGIPDNVCIIPYEETFGNFDRHSFGLQGKLVNWDGTINEEEF